MAKAKPLVAYLDEQGQRTVANIRAAAEQIWAAPLHRDYTDHTVAHSERIVALLDGLTEGMMAAPQRLCPTEILALLAAAYLHDIGMQNERFAGGDLEEIRAAHHEQAAEMIYRVLEDPANAFPIPLPRDPSFVEAVAVVSKGHRRVALDGPEYQPLVIEAETVRLRLLGALIRFADALDIDHRRVDLERMKLMNLSLLSQVHLWRCTYVSGVSIANGLIRIAYCLPQGRPDYRELIVPLVEQDVRKELEGLKEIFWPEGVHVAIGESEVRWMRGVKPMPPEVEERARKWVALPVPHSENTVTTVRAPGLPIQDGVRVVPPTPPQRTIYTGGGAYVEGSVDTGGGDFIGRDKVVGATSERELLGEADTRQQVEPNAKGSAESLREVSLCLYDQERNDLVDRLTLPIPRCLPGGEREAAQIAVRLYLLNRSAETCHDVQIEMTVQAQFLSYQYDSAVLRIEQDRDRWRAGKLEDTAYRCTFEGGANFVCHPQRPGYAAHLGLVTMLVPCGEADDGVVSVWICYRVWAERHAGKGTLNISLQAAGA